MPRHARLLTKIFWSSLSVGGSLQLITNHLSLFSSAFGALPASPAQIFVLGSFFSFFARRDIGELHDPGGSLSGCILTEGRLERQFSVSDLG